ncbi:T9SS type A sorting domain-containing protein [Flavobacterium akiainvivens]|uniref:T9SS type A sorting domain-containing protein n=1 Tax=Flavobacterium akiainvivens TaxID=1202724 RepID=UPI0006C8CB55|nr:T9SS type A sorting domain-containing protein [Flavobacterium akiainvivens]SFQ09028.1 Por secretion system C-terminal sorting domain-containing protein [Flavobacterium akiainvivens]
MKKLYTFLSAVAITAAVNAQTNIVVNGDMEEWTDANTLANFSTFTSNITQEATIKHGGEYSVKQAAPTSGNFPVQNDVTGIIPGHSYTISYWYLDNTTGARSRTWAGWIDSDGGNNGAPLQLDDNADVLRVNTPDSYSTDNAEWQQFTITLTAPAAADGFRFQVRTYRDVDNSGFIYYDDFSMIDNSVTSLVTEEIAGLKLFPNPLAAGSSLNITSNNGTDKSVAIYDVLGKQVFAGTTNRGTVNTTDLKAGIYIVKITEGNKTATRKLIVQ